jgi:hypothetical protein
MLLDDKQKELELIKNIINSMFLLKKHLRVYAAQNQLVEATTSRLLLFLESYLRYHETLSFSVARHGFIYAEGFVERKNKTFEAFAYSLFQHGIAAITIDKDVTAQDLQTFLTLVGRPAAESWEEGGMAKALQIRHLNTISVREMSEADIAFVDGSQASTDNERISEKSPLWDRFAFAIYHGLNAKNNVEAADPDKVNPETLARMTNQLLGQMSAESQQKFSKSLSHYLATLQNEKIKPYRSTALAKLTDFINRISPAIRDKLFQHIFNLNLQPDFSEEFYSGLSNEIIIEILGQAIQEQNYVPPVILKVLSKIASDKTLDVQDIDKLDRKITANKADIVKLFQKDDFEKFVPDKYRKALVNIIQHESISKEVGDHLDNLKQSLEEDQQERHSADIILKILSESPDPEHMKGLDANLVGILSLYLETDDYQNLLTLCRLCLRHDQKQGQFTQLRSNFSAGAFTGQVINAISRHSRQELGDIETLIIEIGVPFIVPLLEKLAMETNRTHRMLYLQILQKLEPVTVCREAVKRLDDQRWFFVRNILYLLRALNNPQTLPYIKPLRHHPHLKVSTEALRTCLQYGCEESKALLLHMLKDNDQKVVEAAIPLAQIACSSDVVSRLVEMLEENAVLDYRFEQKKAIVQTLAEIAPKQTLPVFSRLLTNRNLIHPKQHAKLKEEAIKTFARLDAELAGPFLKGLVAKTKGETRDKLQFLLRKSRT